MSTVSRYVLKKLLATFVPTTLGLCFVFFVGASFRLLREEDLSLAQVAMALPWVVPFLLPYLIPMSFMSTITLVYGRLVADNEVLAFGSLGIRARTLCWPALWLALALTLVCSWLTAQVVPYCHQQKKVAARAVFQQLFSLGEGEHWSRTFPRQGFDIYVRRYRPGQLEGIVIHYVLRKDDLTGDGRGLSTQLVAKTGRIAAASETERLVLVLEEVTVTLALAGDPKDMPTGYEEVDGTAPESRAQRREGKSGATPVAPPEFREQVGEKERDQLASDEPVRLHLERYEQAIALGGVRRIKETDYGSGALRRAQHMAEARASLAVLTGGVTSTLTAMDDRATNAGIELAMRGVLSMSALSIAFIVLPVTLLLRARSPLVPFGVGLAATAGLFFGPTLLGRSLADNTNEGAFVYLGIVVPMLAGGGLAWLASRR